MYQGSYIPIKSFKGGYCANLSPAGLDLDQAFDLDNIVITPNGSGFRTRLGNSKVNSTAFNSGANWQGLGYYLKSAGTEFIVGVAGTKFGSNQNSSGYQTTFTDGTGSATITTGADNQWDFFVFNDIIYGYGGPKDNPDSPFSWSGSGNVTQPVSATAPVAYGGFSANNRAFTFRTSALPQTIFWSILGDATDWSGAGSGSAVVGSLKDNEKITGAKVLSTNYVLIFKESSTYQMVISSNPFPIYSFSDSLGCVGKNASVVIDGIAYWVTQYGRMVSTDGENFKTYPPNADDLWNAVQKSRYPYINGFRQKGADYDWLVWQVSTSGSTNNTTIIWDLLNNCWLKCSTSYKQGVNTADKNGKVFNGGYDGFVYNPDQTAVYADASEVSPGTITAYWRSGWLNFDNMEKIIQPNEIGVLYATKASGSITIKYGFDFIADSQTGTIAQTAATTETRAFKYIKTSGRGNFMNFRISQSSSTIDSYVDQVYIRGKEYGQKVMTNP